MIGSPLVLALALASDPAPTPTPAAPQPEVGSANAGRAGLEVEWAPTMAEAIERARKKPDGRILVELTASDCGECQRQEALVVPSTSFYGFTLDKVPVRLGISSPEGRRLAERFGIPAPPAWIVLTTDGLLCGLQGGPANQQSWIETFMRTEQSWAAYRKKLEEERKTPGDLAVVFDVAEETFRRGGDELAEPRFRRIVESKSAGPGMKERSLAYLASIEMDQKRIPEAQKHLETLLATGTDPVLRERAELRLADVEIAKGRRDLAIARLRQFRKDHPDSPLASQAEGLLRRLEPAGEASSK